MVTGNKNNCVSTDLREKVDAAFSLEKRKLVSDGHTVGSKLTHLHKTA